MQRSNVNRFYVYVHRRKTDGSIFYVGKGSGFRASSKSGRNKWWRRIVIKHGYYYEIIKDGMTNEESCSLEIKLISELRRAGEDICNVANGGESGLVGVPMSKEQKELLSKIKTGVKQHPEWAKKSATAKLGKKQPRDAVEKMVAPKRKPVINSNGDIFPSATRAAEWIRETTGKNASQGNISEVCRGGRNEAYGYSWSYNIDTIPLAPTGSTKAMRRIKCSNGMQFKSVSDATEWVKSWRGTANNQTISSCARGESITAYSLNWEYI